MGCDGGSIPTRSELVKTKQKEQLPDAQAQQYAAWFTCTLSKRPLKAPIVADNLGKLYNKDAILEFLLDRKAYGDGDVLCSHISSLKDLISLNLSPNPAYLEKESASQSAALLTIVKDTIPMSQFACPVTMKEMNGNSRFSFIASCGCVLSEQAFKEIPSDTCLKCNQPFSADDVVPINSLKPEEVERLQTRMEALRAKRLEQEAERKRLKQLEKKQKKQAAAAQGDGPSSEQHLAAEKKKRKRADDEKEAVASSALAPASAPAIAVSAKRLAEVKPRINMPLPNLNDPALASERLKSKSKVIQSLYKKADEKEANFLVRGTFSRF
ncbi:Rtf2 RING-finger-domain-containing protein [Polychytrium aggregatum]|uniref:Rtf2 RING-finger-domain-containing protein n=1 Tax=Polychytrium aggregatum TaxID=110093 RepID=UPI0022FEB744|nr:Rtf2 RING-finger-domain-containing protein [Polychytrium aggregatum]KAI9201958.1 Rtf2 RING-finger-domain-containing protein [Polychytrium aggregatum]